MKNSKSFFICLICAANLFSCTEKRQEQPSETRRLVDYVDPFIGTDGHGHTFPGATRPFGMVQLSPDTYNAGWDWCSGYHASDSSIMGFSHTHLSGTGRGDLLDILMMPTVGKVLTVPGSREDPDEGYRSRFKHANEQASPGYYAVRLDDYDINVQLTATERAGFHHYQFPKTGEANIIFDLMHGREGDIVKGTYIKIENDTLITGYRESKGWGEGDEEYWCDQVVHFAAIFSRPFSGSGIVKDGEDISGNEAEGVDLKAFVRFDATDEDIVLVKVGISSVDGRGALNNVTSEIPHWDFEKTKKESEDIWEEKLQTIIASSQETENLIVFYTSLYHTMIAPNLYHDVDGRYLGFDRKIHTDNSFTNYTTFSLWDTFRAAHPLQIITNPDRVEDFINSMLAQYNQYGLLPVWSLYASETNCMIGYHAAPVIAEAYLKGFTGFDAEAAYKAMKTSAMQDDFGIGFLKQYNYVPTDLENKSVSKTLEYAFDDYCIARMAEALGHEGDAEYFYERSQAYKNVYDQETKLMRGKKADGTFIENFDPTFSSYGWSDFIEGNSWQYSWFVPHDIQGLIDLMGGGPEFVSQLDSLFVIETVESEGKPLDVTGLIGEYAHGNEPSHHVAYLYNDAGEPWKTQARVREIMTTMYDSSRAGLCGNEDCGQMSAWYVFSALGMYPVNPVSGQYSIGAPALDNAKIKVGENKYFEIKAHELSASHQYLQSVKLNGKPLEKPILEHEDLQKGGILEFWMGSEPSSWGSVRQ